MKISLCLVLVALFGCGFAQPSENAKAAFKKKYPNGKDVSWRTDRNNMKEAHFKLNGLKYRADFTVDGKWVETERNVEWDDLPEAVQDAYKKDNDKDDIVEIEEVDHHEKGIFYDIEFKKSGDKQDVEIAPNGHIIRYVKN